MVAVLLIAIIAALLLIASWTDLTTYRIPNRIPLAIFLLFPVFALASGLSLSDVLWHGAAFGITFAAGFVLFAFNKVGGGDVKLFAATALWAGWGTPLIELTTMTAILGGLLSLAILLCRWTPIGVAVGGLFQACGVKLALFDPTQQMAPYALAITGAFFTLLFMPF
ncbi:A24 family peptidase [Aliidongia dinghuensis]|nr:prepilin peptidase [Aliidongia dinghuensis]